MYKLGSPWTEIVNKYLSSMLSKSLLNDSSVALEGNRIIVLDASRAFITICTVKESIAFPYVGFIINSTELQTEYNCNEWVMKEVLDKYNYYKSFAVNELACIIRAKESDESFNNLISNIKADDGCKFYKIYGKEQTYFIPIMTGFPPIGKPDDLDIYVYDAEGIENTLFCKFTIHKKKVGTDYDIVFNILKL